MLVEEPKFRATPFKKVTPEEITQLSSKQWKSADFGHKHLKGNLGPMIEHFRQISYLNLEWNKLTDKDVQLLAPMFKLKGLNLAINDLGMNGLLYLKSLSGLQRLNLQKNKLTAECIPFIANNFRKLVELQLGYNKLNQLEPMMELKKLDKLKILGMEECEIPDECVVQGLATMSTSIETLNLRSNRINGESLANTIMKMKQLKKLYIGYNFIRDNGASLIGFHLHELEQLELCYCHLTNLSGQVIAKNLTKLKKLDIRSNRMGNQTLEALMANIPTLEFLCMNDNQCSSAECILAHPNLKKIQLDFNKFDDKFDKENKVQKLKDELAKKGVQISIITSV